MDSQGNADASVEPPSPTKTEIDKQENNKRANEIEMTNRFIHSTILEIINEARQKAGLSTFYDFVTLGEVAIEYAQWFARDRNDEVTPNPNLPKSRAMSAGYEGE